MTPVKGKLSISILAYAVGFAIIIISSSIYNRDDGNILALMGVCVMAMGVCGVDASGCSGAGINNQINKE